ncbi:hypothetical protein J4460_01800 [Candidatus Woesearchaeota archaeon]|nr:MAG: tRNA (guanine26-N2/guanine27-N2)-dimethyltransferase [archaeon GW2011_AR4]MBS3129385.1 hypothetical protein [Candidatus Woesearchaeota archaeon]HIH38426.1 hypothetical protein [Candidatus Woesearchaeota archaeon]HIH48115.1 hypothetical protein [Candidatus Woesearchaeota archaeon]HIJ03439.1 hypothetical protein [Candidatus Woesearchaeota archaeon]
MKETIEGKARLCIPEGKISKQLPVFYNPVMEKNRTLMIELLRALGKKKLNIALPLAGSGIRGIRMLKELPASLIAHVSFNDYSEAAVAAIKKHLLINNVPKTKTTITCADANLFLIKSKGFDVIDIDPFGTPIPFLDEACKKISRGGVLGVTATDTALLCGTYPKACLRTYWAEPLHTPEMYEVGLRILIRKVQLIGAQYDKALLPLLSYSSDHYMRVVFLSEKGKSKADETLKLHGGYKGAGPLWLSQLQNKQIISKMRKNLFIDMLIAEPDIVGYTDLHSIDFKEQPKIKEVLAVLKRKGFIAERTHFLATAIKTNCPDVKAAIS